jgi:hypothetical protein
VAEWLSGRCGEWRVARGLSRDSAFRWLPPFGRPPDELALEVVGSPVILVGCLGAGPNGVLLPVYFGCSECCSTIVV